MNETCGGFTRCYEASFRISYYRNRFQTNWKFSSRVWFPALKNVDTVSQL